MDVLHRFSFIIFLVIFSPFFLEISEGSRKFPASRITYYRNKVKAMFDHAYSSYLKYAYPLDELKPISCAGMDTWGSFSLSLIDSLDTLLIMGNETEFIRAANVIVQSVKLDTNINVSVFETNIRVIGGLLSGHLLSGRVKGMSLDPSWPCSGPLLNLAERFAQKLLPAFNTNTGMPYGTVNLKYGLHRSETPVTCTAGVGTLIIEFGTLTKLTGNAQYERLALKALDKLWESRSDLGLVGNHINVQTGEWTATDAGIGAGIDSYFEYLAKGALLFQRPALMWQFKEYVKVINKYIRKEDWFLWVSMTNGQVSLPIFQSLEAFWPGILALTGEVEDAQRILLQYSQIIRQYGFPPEFYNLPKREVVTERSGYPLRPEFIESLYYLYKATEDPIILQLAADIIEAIEHSCRTSCGYATIENVDLHTIEDRMESFFLSETTKYLYLIFDPENFINSDGTKSRLVQTPNGPCVIDSGNYIFNTEAHPIDAGAIYCCGAERKKSLKLMTKFENDIDFSQLIDISDPSLDFHSDFIFDESDLSKETRELRDVKMKEMELENRENVDTDDAKQNGQEAKDAKENDFSDDFTCIHNSTCSPMNLSWNSVSLRRMLRIIYGKKLDMTSTLDLLDGVCLPNERSRCEEEYSLKWPSNVVDDDEPSDAIDDIRLGSFKYRSLANLHYELMSSAPVPFSLQFTGLGQIIRRTANVSF